MRMNKAKWRKLSLTHLMLSVSVLLVVSGLTSGTTYSILYSEPDYENAADKGSELERIATTKFITLPQSIIVNEGETLRLPCMVKRLGGFVLLWRKNSDIITVASQIIDKRVRLSEKANGNHLILGQSTPEDSGEYTCQISDYKPTEITHKVLVRGRKKYPGTPYSEPDYDYDAENKDVLQDTTAVDYAADKGSELELIATPKFITLPQSIIVNEGETLRLPCMVERLGEFVLLWKKKLDIITVASHIIDKRVRLSEEANGNHLILGQATPEDSGEYTCQISAYTPTEITHKVLIRVKSEISTTPQVLSSHGDLLTFRTEAKDPEPVTEMVPVAETDEALVTEPLQDQVTEHQEENRTSEQLPSYLTSSSTQLKSLYVLIILLILSLQILQILEC